MENIKTIGMRCEKKARGWWRVRASGCSDLSSCCARVQHGLHPVLRAGPMGVSAAVTPFCCLCGVHVRVRVPCYL